MIKMYRSILLMAPLLLVSCTSKERRSNIQKISSFAQVLPTFGECAPNTLVTFDVDDTLITSPDTLSNTCHYPLLFKLQAFWNHPELLNREKLDWVLSILFKQAERYLYDPTAITLVNELKKRGCMTLALTSIDSGALGVISNMHEWRASMLKQFGLEFDDRFSETEFKGLPSYRNNHPRLYKGILFANQQNKGVVLGAFLDFFHLKPKKVISFDNRIDQLEDIADECKKRGIEFQGYQHNEACEHETKSWNTQRALEQLDIIMKEGRFANDAELANNSPHSAKATP